MSAAPSPSSERVRERLGAASMALDDDLSDDELDDLMDWLDGERRAAAGARGGA